MARGTDVAPPGHLSKCHEENLGWESRLAGWRHVEVTDRRTKLDFAHLLRNMADVHVPGRKIVPVIWTT